MDELIRKQDAIDIIMSQLPEPHYPSWYAEQIKALPTVYVPDMNAGDMISRQAAIDLLKQMRKDGNMVPWEGKNVFDRIRKLPSVQPETCEGCKHLGKWANEVEYGYPSPCTCCKRRVDDHYER